MDINQAWKETCHIVLGDEIGELKQYEEYLFKYLEPVLPKTSAISGKPVNISRPSFCPKAKFISNDEMSQYDAKIRRMPLDINQIKDLDSILAAIGPQFYYAGNQVTGNSADVNGSDSIIDSQVVYKSSEIWGGKYVACSSMGRLDEFIFGVNWSGEAKYLISCYQTFRQQRCFQTNITFESSDCYYTSNLWGCTDCLFTFNQRNQRHLVGNLALPKDEYLKVKAQLLEQIRSELQNKKNIVSIFDLLRGRDAD